MELIKIIFISFFLFSLINSTCQPEEENNKIREPEVCNKRAFNEEEVNSQAYKCCYMTQKVDLNSRKGKDYSCIYITQNDYNNIKELIKQYERETGIDDVDIDCKSTYIRFALLSLLILLF